MKPATRRLILKLARFQREIDAANERANAGYEMDSQFDGGEFSGPATMRALKREENALAQRFGFATYEVAMEAASALKAVIPFPAYFHTGSVSLPN